MDRETRRRGGMFIIKWAFGTLNDLLGQAASRSLRGRPPGQIRPQAFGDASGGRLHRIPRQMRVARRGLHLPVAEQLADQHRVESALAVPGDVQHDPLAARVDRLAGRAVAVVDGLAFRRVGQMDVHLGAQHALGQGLLQLRGQRLKIQGPASTSPRNQLIQQLARDPIVVFLRHSILQSNSSWYGSYTQKSLQALLESNDQALVIAVRLFETELLNAELVKSVKVPDGFFT